MTALSRDRKKAWDERLERIATGRTLCQVAEAEGSIPQKMAKASERRRPGIRGLAAWIMSSGFGWSAGLSMAVVSPGTQLTAKYDLKSYAPLAETYVDPILAFIVFMFVMSFLRIEGAVAKLLGLTMLAWMCAMDAGLDVPTMTDVVSFGQAAVTGDVAWAETLAPIVEWAINEPA